MENNENPERPQEPVISTPLFADFTELGRQIFRKAAEHVAADECDEWCEEIMDLAEKLGLVRKETYDPEKHGPMNAEPGEDYIWTWSHLPVDWRTGKPTVEFVGIDGKPETDPNKCGFLRINDPDALRAFRSANVHDDPRIPVPLVRGVVKNTCDTCKHWQECDWMSDEDEVRGLCNHPMVYRPTFGPERNNQRHTDTWKPDRVYTCDEGGGTGELCTGPKFGCIHYQSGGT